MKNQETTKIGRKNARPQGFASGLALAFDFSGSLAKRVPIKTADEMLRAAWGTAFWHLQQSYQAATNDFKTSPARD